jgi:hypothetical protein
MPIPNLNVSIKEAVLILNKLITKWVALLCAGVLLLMVNSPFSNVLLSSGESPKIALGDRPGGDECINSIFHPRPNCDDTNR